MCETSDHTSHSIYDYNDEERSGKLKFNKK